MEGAIDKYFGLIVDRLECSFFGTNDESSNNRENYYRPFVITDANILFSDFLNYLELQAFFGLLCNIFLFAVLFLYVPSNFLMCLSCSPILTIWLTIMGFISTLLIIPKVILLRKLFRIEETLESLQPNYYLWAYFHSKAFLFNRRLGKLMNGSYIIGFILFNIAELDGDNCQNLWGLVAFLLICFLVSLILSFWKMFNKLAHSLCFETLFQSVNDTFTKGISALDVMKYSEYTKKYVGKDCSICSICYEIYENKSLVRIMKCLGSHVFHKDCIDKWLFKSARCPECNLNVLGKPTFPSMLENQ